MADTIRLEIVTPESTVYSEDVDMVAAGSGGSDGRSASPCPADDAISSG